MAIAYKGGNRITGLSTDTRPDVINLVDGTIFTETNTGKEYIKYYGDWTERNQPNNSAGLSLNYADETNQHFWDFFSGKQLSSRWNTDVTGSGTATMSDSINGGLLLQTSNGTNHATEINFDGERQYTPQASVFICVFKPDVNYANTNHFSDVGLIAGTSFYAGGQMLMCEAHSGQTYIRFRYASETWADTSVAFHQNRTVTRIESTSSNSTISLDGVLQSSTTQTGSLPTNNLQPCASEWHGTGTPTAQLHVNYMEAYNT